MKRIRDGVVSFGVLMTFSLLTVSARQANMTKKNALEGTVIDSQTQEPIPETKVRLLGGSIDHDAYEQLKRALAARQIVVPPPDNRSAEELIEAGRDLAMASGITSSDRQFLQNSLRSFESLNDSRFSAQSDIKGGFRIENVPPGIYRVRIEREGYFRAVSAAADLVVTVTADRIATVTLEMIRGATIAGRVTHEGRPQVRWTVRAYAITYQGRYPLLRPLVNGATDDRGQYRLSYLPQGDYLVVASPRDPPFPKVVRTTEVPALAESPSATPIELMPTFYPGTVDAGSADIVSIQGGSDVSNVDIPVQSSVMYHISGEIRTLADSTGGPANSSPTNTATAELSFVPSDALEADLGKTPLAPITLQRIGGYLVGNFQLNTVVPGIYDLEVSSRVRGALIASGSITSVDVRYADVDGLRVDLSPVVTVKGNVTVDGKPPDAHKFRVWLEVNNALARTPSFKGLPERSADKDTGAFAIDGVPQQRYHVMVGGTFSPDIYIEDVRSGGETVFDVGIDATADLPPVEVRLRSGAGTISGFVIDGARKAAAGATVALVPAVPYRQNPARFRAAIADADGKFNITNVGPGEYKLFSWSNVPAGAYFDETFLSHFEENGFPVTISEYSPTVTAKLTALKRQ